MDRIKKYIERGREIEAKATPGRWSAGMYLGGAGEIYQAKPNGDRIRHVADCFVSTKDAAFIAHSRNHHARLLAALEVAVNTIEAEQKRTGGTVPLLKSGLTRIATILEGNNAAETIPVS